MEKLEKLEHFWGVVTNMTQRPKEELCKIIKHKYQEYIIMHSCVETNISKQYWSLPSAGEEQQEEQVSSSEPAQTTGNSNAAYSKTSLQHTHTYTERESERDSVHVRHFKQSSQRQHTILPLSCNILYIVLIQSDIFTDVFAPCFMPSGTSLHSMFWRRGQCRKSSTLSEATKHHCVWKQRKSYAAT